MILVDSSAWISALRGHERPASTWLQKHVDSAEIGTAELCLCEVLQGARPGSDFWRHRSTLLQFPVVACSGTELILDAAERYGWLRSKGITLRSTIDCIVATLCIREGFQLLHDDRDFDVFERYFDLDVVTV